ncbi:hypothetical protein TSAR_003966 [Trichomalopsis sarcophagae]|uniref:Uncharacterized protein n=1 Tax=Trichomalopsis sarcophagae TaxID=543379 RepID=A0A232F5S7_9HYME|nr:hypothetical protein TSAR_003966 [Trichomalopsis sarcophagae]
MAAGEATLHLPRIAEVRHGENPSPEEGGTPSAESVSL